MSGYNSSKDLRHRAFGVDELRGFDPDKLKSAMKSSDSIQHFLARLEATAGYFTEQMQQMQAEVHQLGFEKTQRTSMSTLSPIESVQFVPTETLKEYVRDVELANRLGRVHAMGVAAAEELTRIRGHLDGVRTVLAELIATPSLPADVLHALQNAQTALGFAPTPDAEREHLAALIQALHTDGDITDAARRALNDAIAAPGQRGAQHAAATAAAAASPPVETPAAPAPPEADQSSSPAEPLPAAAGLTDLFGEPDATPNDTASAPVVTEHTPDAPDPEDDGHSAAGAPPPWLHTPSPELPSAENTRASDDDPWETATAS